MMTIVLLIAGLVLLVVGAEFLVKGASRVAAAFGVSPLVIGLTIVAFGTSAPEMAVSVGAAWSGQADLSLGNVVGSNIFNVLFILGLSALVTPLIVNQQLVRLDVPLMIVASFLVLAFGLDGKIGRTEGVVLFSAIIAYTVFLIVQSRKETNLAVKAEYEQEYATKDTDGATHYLRDGAIYSRRPGLAGIGFPMAGRQCNYHRPVFRGERVDYRFNDCRRRNVVAGAGDIGHCLNSR